MTLADRIEALDGPSREVDAKIFWEVIGFPSRKYSRAMGLREKGVKQPTEMEWLAASNLPPSYTSSLDAAMMLVPEGWNWMAGERNQGKFRAYVNNNQPSFVGIGATPNPRNVWFETTAASPAIALAACALRAREQSQ